MNILIVSATEFEIRPLLDVLGIQAPINAIVKSDIMLNNHQIHVLVTGVGMVNTAFKIGQLSNKSFDYVINAGICGAFNKNFNLGQVVNVTTDVLSELGAEDGDDFLTYDKLNMPGEFIFTNHSSYTNDAIQSLVKAKGITVNTVHGNDASIRKIQQLYQPDVESMEGAAFFASSLPYYKQCFQIRSISNYVEKRDKTNWQMPLAIKNLNDFLITFIKSI